MKGVECFRDPRLEGLDVRGPLATSGAVNGDGTAGGCAGYGEAMSDGDDAETVGRQVIAAIAALLEGDMAPAGELAGAPSRMSQYVALAVAAAAIRWTSRETGRPEADILGQLAANYDR